MKPFDKFYSTTELARVPSEAGETIWVYTGDGWYAKFISGRGRWLETDDRHFVQSES